MGVKDLNKLIKRYAPNSSRKATYSEFSGEVWTVDASIFLYKFSYDQESKKANPCIDGFYQLINRLYKYGIQPEMILDGQKPIEKANTIKERSDLTKEKHLKVENIKKEIISLLKDKIGDNGGESGVAVGADNADNDEFDKILETNKMHLKEPTIVLKMDELREAKKNIIRFDPNIYKDLTQLCKLFNVPIYRANWEADALCTKRCNEGYAQSIMSEDSDILFYKGNKLMRKFDWSDKIEVVDLEQLLKDLEITYDQFMDLCILCGTDYTVETISGIGPISAYKLIKEGLTIENIIDKIIQSKTSTDKDLKSYKKYDLPKNMSDFDYVSARKLVKNAHGLENLIESRSVYDPTKIAFDELSKMMIEKCNYKQETINKHIQLWMESASPQPNNTPVKSTQPKIKLPLKLPLKSPIIKLHVETPTNNLPPIKPKIKLSIKC